MQPSEQTSIPCGLRGSTAHQVLFERQSNSAPLSSPRDDIDLPKGQFDVVSMVDVIEHFSDPMRYLQKAASVMKTGGVLYIVTPNIASLSAKPMGRYWWGLRSAHLYYFSPVTLEKMLLKSGFKIVQLRSYGRMFTYGYWLSRLKNYPFWVRQPINTLIKTMGIIDKIAYINTFDSIELCAVKDLN